jgi:SH3-like domain-containing protein
VQSALQVALALCIGCGATLAGEALDYRSVSSNGAVLYDGPSFKASKTAVVGHAYPVELISRIGEWCKVRDPTGELSWIECKNLSDRRMVLVVAPLADVRERPDDKAPVSFQAEKEVVLELTESVSGYWAKVRHSDGASGYVRADQIWGL